MRLLSHLSFLLVLVWGTSVSAQAELSRQITVSGQGVVNARPDMAVVTLGVVTESRSAQEAMSENAKEVAEVLAALALLGVEEDDIQTSRLSLSPRYARESSLSGAPPGIVAFNASNMITVTMRDLKEMGGTLDAILEAGANRFEGLRFELSDQTEALATARRAAVEDARAAATLYAEMAGVALGEVISITEGSSAAPGPVFMEAAQISRAGEIPISPGVVSTQANVTIVWEIVKP